MAIALEGISRTADADVFSKSWWFEPFGVDLVEFVKRLPEIIPASKLVERDVAHEGSSPFEPAAGEKGVILAWPNHLGGLASLITVSPSRNAGWLGGWPFTYDGIRHRVAIEEVLVDRRVLEGLVRGSIGPMTLEWHDPFFALDRDHYGQGSVHCVALAGFAHALRFGAPPPAVIRKDSPNYEVLSEMNPGGVREDGGIEIRMEGMAALMPIDGAPGFFQFQGPVTSGDWLYDPLLARNVLRLTVTVARIDEPEDQDVDIVVLVTDVVLDGREPPKVGDDVGGHLRLQGVIRDANLQHRD